jgi:hypothetical protein
MTNLMPSKLLMGSILEGKPKRVALDTGHYSVTNIEGLEARQTELYIAT